MPKQMRRLYWVWASMRKRCENPKDPSYVRYGALGVMVCERWQSFDNFLEDMGIPETGMSIDRFPNASGNYEPGNCRWATSEQQSNNRPRFCIHVDVDGECLTLKQAWRKLSPSGLTYRALHKRVTERSWPVMKAITTP